MTTIPTIPVLRRGKIYESYDLKEVKDHRTGETMAHMGQANGGLIRRDLMEIEKSFQVLRSMSTDRLIEISKKAGEYFMEGTLPLGLDGATQNPQEFVETLSKTSGLPHSLCRKNMAKVNEVFTLMDTIIDGLTRSLDLKIIDEGFGIVGGSPVSFFPETTSMGVILPSNSPGVNSIWMPSIALKIPVVLKPGKDEPWTPYRIIQSFIAAGCPPEAFSFYPTSHEGSGIIMQNCGRSIIFGDEGTIAQYAGNPRVQVHGPGWSKVMIGDDQIENWRDHIDVIVNSIAANGGRSCVNASMVLVPKYAKEIAEELGKRLTEVFPRKADDEQAILSAFANPAFADYMDGAIEEGLRTPGAEDVTAKYRSESRRVELEGSTFLHPTLIHCESMEHPLANREFMFPFASIVEVPQKEMLNVIGQSLVVSAITEDESWIHELLDSPNIDRLNIGALPTSVVKWDQPHEGNLFEFLYKRRAIQREALKKTA